MPKPTVEQFYRAAGQPLPPREWIDGIQRALAMLALDEGQLTTRIFEPFVLSLGRTGLFVYPAEPGPHDAPGHRDREAWNIADQLTCLAFVLSSHYPDSPQAWFTLGTRCIVPQRLLPGNYILARRHDPTQIDCTVRVVDLPSADRGVLFETSDGTRFMPPYELLAAALRADQIVLLAG